MLSMREQGRHYERAFEEYLRVHRIPYVAVDEARRALVPAGIGCGAEGGGHGGVGGDDAGGELKSFDFVVYGAGGVNLLVDVKGRRAAGAIGRTSSLQSWVTEEDVRSLQRWERLFAGAGPAAGEPGGSGAGFRAAFVFMYWCDGQPPDALFQEVFEYRGRWYALRMVPVGGYAAAMKPRSGRWRTVHLPARDFERLSQPFSWPALAPRPAAVPLYTHAAAP